MTLETRKTAKILAYAHASKQNIVVQFTTEAGSKSSLIVRKRFCSKD